MLIIIGIVVVVAVFAVAAFGIAYWKLSLWKLPIRPVIIGPKEMAILVILGEPIKFLNSGLHWIPLFINCYVERRPKKLFNLDFPARKAVTRESKKDGTEDPAGEQVVTVDSVAYATLPQCFAWVQFADSAGAEDKNREIKTVNSKKELEKLLKDLEDDGKHVFAQGGLVKVVESDVSIDEEGLKQLTKQALVGALRVAVGHVTWRKATEDIEDIRYEAEEVFRRSDGTLIKAGFFPTDLIIAIEEINLPRALEIALTSLDEARLGSEASEYIKKTMAAETIGAVMEMMGRSRGMEIEEVQALIRQDKEAAREFRELSIDLVKRRMAQDSGSLVDIRVDGANGIEHVLLDFLATWQRMPQGRQPNQPKKKRRRRTMMKQTMGGEPLEIELDDDEEEEGA
ncbi:hypothetical protein ACFL06_00270 [Patescibacteria group bacterium]